MTTCTVNNKTYIGMHECENPNVFDGYLGENCWTNNPKSYKFGKSPLAYEIAKYGVRNFRRSTLKIFNTEKEANEFLSKLLTNDFVADPTTYNDHVMKTRRPRIPKNDTPGAIFQYSRSFEYINTFDSVKEAANKLQIDARLIQNSLLKKSRTCGFYFIWADDDIKNINDRRLKIPSVIYRYDPRGNLVAKYEHLEDVVKDFPERRHLSLTGIKRAVWKEAKYINFYWSRFLYRNFHKRKEIKNLEKVS